MNDKVKFGLKEISKKTKPQKVSDIFSTVSDKYDLMNDFMSFGLHRKWKDKMIQVCEPQSKSNAIDIATGSGDIALGLLKKNNNLSLTCLDNNKEMLELSKNKLMDKGYIKNLRFILSSAEKIKLDENSYDLATIAFGFRNFTDHLKALSHIYKILKPGGKLVIMEFSKPKKPLMNKLFKEFTFKIIPKIGDIVANDIDSYNYLAESIESYYSPPEVTEMLGQKGFIKTNYMYIFNEVVTIHTGYKS